MSTSGTDDERTVEAIGRAIDEAGSIDELEERRMLARVEQQMFRQMAQPLRLSRYFLLAPLGAGGAGVVYDGYDPELARRVAIKVLRPDRRSDVAAQRSRVRFVREAQSIARLSHPNVIAVYDVGTYSASQFQHEPSEDPPTDGSDDAVFIVMEVVDGADLRSWLEERTRTWREILDVFIAAGRGLAGAHEAGVIHRDFKPGNVLVGKDGRVKVVDFGLALTYGVGAVGPPSDEGAAAPGETTGPELLDEVSSGAFDTGDSGAMPDEKLTRTGVVLGTPVFMAPEQHAGAAADQKADQFSFCASLYRALYGRFPFRGKSVDELYAEKVHARIRRPPEKTTVPPWVWRIVVRGLAPDPADRYADMPSLIAALDNDPARVRRRWMRRATVPLAIGALSYSGYVLSRPGTVQVVVQASGAAVAGLQVFVDDVPLPVEGDRAMGQVSAGLHRVRVTAPDHRTGETLVDVRRGGTHEVAVELHHEQGTFALDVDPRGGSVLVDGVDYGSRLTNLAIDTGPHEILVRHEGYEDQRLAWQAQAGVTERGFVSLRKALVWSQPMSGTDPWSRWIGDGNGDGRSELLHRRFAQVTAYDPWRGDDLWRIELRRNTILDACDADRDGVADVVTLEWENDTTRVAVRSGRATNGYEPTLTWAVTSDPQGRPGPDIPVGRALCATAAGPLLVVGGPWGPTLVGYDGATGKVRWSVDVGAPILDVVELTGDPSTRVVVVTASALTSFDLDGEPQWRTEAAVMRVDTDAERLAWVDELARHRSMGHAWATAASTDAVAGADVVLFTGRLDAPVLRAFAGTTGAAQWSHPAAQFDDLARPGTTLDADGDGATDLLLSTADGYEVIDGATGTTRWHELAPSGALTRAWLLPLTPTPVLATRTADRLQLREASSGAVVAESVTGELSSAPVAADWDGDGDLDIVAGVDTGDVVAWDRTLTRIGAVPMPVTVTHLDPRRDGDVDGFPDLLVEAQGPAVLVGPKVRWRRGYHDAVRAGVVVDDFAGDGELEALVVAPDAEGRWLHRLDAGSGTERQASAASGANVIRRPTTWSGAAGLELFFVGSGHLHRLRASDLSPLAAAPFDAAWAPPAVVDLDGDGRPEVFQAAWDPRDELIAFDGETLGERWRAPVPGGSFDAPAVLDLDGDGQLELVVSSLEGHLVAIDGRAGTVRWSTDTGGRLNYAPAAGHLDADGVLDLLVSPKGEANDLVVLRGDDGAEQHRWPGLGSRRSRPVLHDGDGDGRPEIISATRTAGVVKIGSRGEIRWRHEFIDENGEQPSSSGPAVLADLEHDGRMEVLTGFEGGSLRVLDATTGELQWVFHTAGGDIEGPPVVADVDGDGVDEVFVVGHDRHVYCLRHRPARGRKLRP